MVFLGDEEGAIQDELDGRDDGGRGSLTVLNNALTIWEAARGDGTAANFAEALRR